MHEPLDRMPEYDVTPLSVQLFSAEELTQREARAAAEFARIQQLIRALIRLNRQVDRLWDDYRHHLGWEDDNDAGAPNRPEPPMHFESAEAYIKHKIEVEAFEEQSSRLRKRHKQAVTDAEQTRNDLFRLLKPEVWYYADEHGVMISSGRLVLSPWSDLPTADRLADIEF
jgi:hypothetical protein